MKTISLLVMAAGMGSRYGGLKQLDPVGPNGETIIDYSVYDAIQSGFNQVVFVIRKEFEDQFREDISNKYLKKIDVKHVFQELDNLPNGHISPGERKKPWGTGHAILCAQKLIKNPFVVINGDDFYGLGSFKAISTYYTSKRIKDPGFCMVAYKLKNTLSEHGTVTRGLCTVDSSSLSSIKEVSGLKRAGQKVETCYQGLLNGHEPVSMNFWGFTPKIFEYLNLGFTEFLYDNCSDLKSEFLIPNVINDLITSKKEKIEVLTSDSKWFGVTYLEDKMNVINKIRTLTHNNNYPNPLF